METIETRRHLFREQVDRLTTFSLDYVRRHRQDVRAIDRQRDNLLQAITACGEYLGDWPRAAQIALGLEEYMLRRGRWRSWAGYLEHIGQAIAEWPDRRLEGEIWHALGNAYCGSGEWEAALRAHQRAIESFRRAGDLQGIAHALFDLGRVHWFRGAWREAVRCYRRADAYARSLPHDRFFRARVANVMGLVYWRRGQWRRAARWFRRALRLCPGGIEYARNRSRMMSNLALALTDLGRWEEAERWYRAALASSERVSDVTGQAYTWGDLSELYRRWGRLDEAEVCLKQADALWEEAEDAAGRADYAEHRGRLHADRGEMERALRWLKRALARWEMLGNLQKQAELQTLLAELTVKWGDHREAEEWMERAHALARQLGRRDLLVRLHGLKVLATPPGHPLRRAGAWAQVVASALPAFLNDGTRRALSDVLRRARSKG